MPRSHMTLSMSHLASRAFVFSSFFVLIVTVPIRGSFGIDEGLDFFEQKIRPVLIEHCYECHSIQASKREGGLLLDSRQGLQAGGDSGEVILKEDPAGSLLLKAIRHEELEMPPDGKLSAETIEDFRRWIEMGTPDPRDIEIPAKKKVDYESLREHWAYQPIRSLPVPMDQSRSSASSIDAFVAARLQEVNAQFNRQADRETLAKRIFVDLTGLLPSPDELAEFLSDSRPDAVERLSDRLLASPRYAEHWARHWLDIARYADSNGGDINLTYHQAWRYRDYVIDSYAEDRSYRAFVIEQIAGDLLPASSDEERIRQLTAAGYLMIGPKMLSERDKEKLKMDVVDEQLDSIGKGLLGTTIGCARCHDHKFDPFSQNDYYSIAGVFENIITVQGIRMNNVNVSGWTEVELPTSPELKLAWKDYEEGLSQRKNKQKELTSRLKKLEAELKNSGSGPFIVLDETEAELQGDWKKSTYTPKFVGKEYIHDDNNGKGMKSVKFTLKGLLPGEYELQLSYTSAGARANNVPVRVSQGSSMTLFEVDQTKKPELDELYHSVGKFAVQEGPLEVLISNENTNGHVIVDSIRLVAPKQNDGTDSPVLVSAKEMKNKLEAEIGDLKKEVESAGQAIKDWEKSVPSKIPVAMAPEERKSIGESQIRIRGDSHRVGAKVPRGFPQFINASFQAKYPNDQSGRLEFARWVADAQNPLTYRVYVNRVWRHLLGRGIVHSVDNFGTLGDKPANPDLLDFLANKFQCRDGETKPIIREIVSSRTYQQAARVDSDILEKDPENRLFARQSVRRFEAEVIRDNLLGVTERLDFNWKYSPVEEFGEQAVANERGAKENSLGGRSRTRSIYQAQVRNSPSDFSATFDGADMEMVIGAREPSNVPAQALFMLNSPHVEEASQALAKLLLEEFASGDEAQRDEQIVVEAFRRVFCRIPSPAELSRSREMWRELAEVEAGNADTAGRSRIGLERLIHIWLSTAEFRVVE